MSPVWPLEILSGSYIFDIRNHISLGFTNPKCQVAVTINSLTWRPVPLSSVWGMLYVTGLAPRNFKWLLDLKKKEDIPFTINDPQEHISKGSLPAL